MTTSKKPALWILILLISFGSVGAVCFTPGLPELASYFGVSSERAQQTVTLFLVGYAFGQLLYGPLANRFGSTKTIMLGALVETIGALGCILAAPLHSFEFLLFSRLLMALGAGSGLKMTFTLTGKLFSQAESARVISILSMAFAITPGLGVFFGGILVTHFSWQGPFYLMLIYGLVLLLVSKTLPEAYATTDCNALKLKPLMQGYMRQFGSMKVVAGGLLIGVGTCVVYLFASLAPFIAIEKMGLSPSTYGTYNFLPALGILLGSLMASALSKKCAPQRILKLGLGIGGVGVIIQFILLLTSTSPLALFVPMVIINFGMASVFGNASALAIHSADDKGNASAVMSFMNMASACVAVLALGFFNVTAVWVLPAIYMALMLVGWVWYLGVA